ncbi:PP2C family protein-serine/threonine phosphatase [Aureibacter tunicatorum]|uniref:Serine phosphatase RsbU (Regulator of sigma subunit) n=1 Tax=Aureibacter tunicatorum TaxID=866807 RepID=A0AAE3XIK0_9BACT|nr:YfiR/HmsC family protein [Aureibacter tunicatorum]MDR6237080.1 serine phosphatase RsbU (regulator of sigma subunit) [Aureibacter tunicatorum]BDD06072.1 hypothetical protein AUTU_35550 [Aureibacter tunicatorum]
MKLKEENFLFVKVRHFLILVILPLFLFTISFQALGSADEEKMLEKKADFIFQLAKDVQFSQDLGSTYKIGLLGRSREIKSLFKLLEEKNENGLKVNGKSVEFFHFRRYKKVKPVNLLYLSADEKVKFGDLQDRLGDEVPFFIVTEDYPFGTSMFNITFDEEDNLIYELQENIFERKQAILSKSLLSSPKRIKTFDAWEQKFNKVNAMLKEEKKVTEVQKELIDDQTKEITEKSGVIKEKDQELHNHRVVLAVILFFLCIIGGMSYWLYRLNISRKEALAEVKKKNKNILSSINYARRIQEAMLPPRKDIESRFGEISLMFKPKDIVSGDFYWYMNDESKTMLAVADCTGHGVPGGFMSMLGSELLNKVSRLVEWNKPENLLTQVDNDIKRNLRKEGAEQTSDDGMDISLLSFNSDLSKVFFSGANNPLLLIRGNEDFLFRGTKRGLGGSKRNKKEFEAESIDLQKGDVLYMFTDGFQDQFGGPDNRKFMRKKLCLLLKEISSMPMKQQEEKLASEFDSWKGTGKQMDDVTVLGMRI